jgi:tetratricopeptide (TPR) repeat protein
MEGNLMKKHPLVSALSLASLTTIIVLSLEGRAIAQSAGMQCASLSGDAAISACTEAIKQNSGNWRLYYIRGKAWSEKQEYDKAIADYVEAIKVDPKQSLPYFSRGLVWSEKREWDKAIADYNETIRLQPIIVGGAVAFVYNMRGTAWLNKLDYDKAIADYNEAIRLNPKSELAKRNLKRALEAKGK